MTLSADDEVTLVELGVVAIGVVITWLVYRRGPDGTVRSTPGRTEARRGSSSTVQADRGGNE